MRILFLASGEFAVPTLRRLAHSEFEVPLVVTQPARPAGRGQKLVRTPVAEWAAGIGLEILEVADINDPLVVNQLKTRGADLGLVIAFGQKLGNPLLAALPGGFINLHASLLPKYRGAAPINWAIVRGEEKTGCTVFRIVEKMDAGPILSSRWTYIKPEETAGELHDRLAGVGVDTVLAALEQFSGEAIPAGTPQNDAEVTLAPKLKKTDGVIDWHKPAFDVVSLIHGMTPWPGATARYESKDGRWEQVTVVRAREAEDPTILTNRSSGGGRPASGTIDGRLYVSTKDGSVELLEIKPSSGRVMPWPDYVNGRHVSAGDRFAAIEDVT